ncbi:MAG: signal transduction protein [Paucimonas sp.]|nr:signal transduction protein [Paucimonas sp.]
MSDSGITSVVQKIHLDEVVEEIQQLPALSAVVTDLLNSIDRDDIDTTELAHKISRDQALTAKALRFANSSYYAKSKVTTLHQAISVVGINALRNLVLAAAMEGTFPDHLCRGFDFKAFWRHSIGTAACARVLARHLHLNQNLAFTAGLLHDIGRLVLVTRFTHQYEAALDYRNEYDCHLLDAERTVLGIDHLLAGHALGTHWQFSDPILHAIIGHHEPDSMGGGSLAALINVANAVAHALDFSHAPEDLVPPVSLVAWNGVGLGTEDYMHVFRETELEFQEMSRIF